MMTPTVLHWLIVANWIAIGVNVLSIFVNVRSYLRRAREAERLLADLCAMAAHLRGMLTMKRVSRGEDVDG